MIIIQKHLEVYDNVTEMSQMIYKQILEHYVPKLEIKYCNVMVDGQNFLDQRIKYDLRTYEKIL